MDDAAREAWDALFGLLMEQRGHLAGIAAALDLTPQQAWTLHVLAETGPQTMGLLAERFACDASNVTGIVDKLEARGLLERQASARDRRARLVSLTREGSRLAAKLAARLREPPRWLRDLDVDDARALRDLLRKAQRGGDGAGPGTE